MEKIKNGLRNRQKYRRPKQHTPKCFSPFYQMEVRIAMKNYECSECHNNFDPGELRQGMCPDCRETIEYKEHCRREAERVMTANFRQIRMEEILHG